MKVPVPTPPPPPRVVREVVEKPVHHYHERVKEVAVPGPTPPPVVVEKPVHHFHEKHVPVPVVHHSRSPVRGLSHGPVRMSRPPPLHLPLKQDLVHGVPIHTPDDIAEMVAHRGPGAVVP